MLKIQYYNKYSYYGEPKMTEVSIKDIPKNSMLDNLIKFRSFNKSKDQISKDDSDPIRIEIDQPPILAIKAMEYLKRGRYEDDNVYMTEMLEFRDYMALPDPNKWWKDMFIRAMCRHAIKKTIFSRDIRDFYIQDYMDRPEFTNSRIYRVVSELKPCDIRDIFWREEEQYALKECIFFYKIPECDLLNRVIIPDGYILDIFSNGSSGENPIKYMCRGWDGYTKIPVPIMSCRFLYIGLRKIIDPDEEYEWNRNLNEMKKSEMKKIGPIYIHVSFMSSKYHAEAYKRSNMDEYGNRYQIEYVIKDKKIYFDWMNNGTLTFYHEKRKYTISMKHYLNIS